MALDRNPGFLQRLGIGQALVVQHVAFGGDDDRRRDAGEARRQQRRGAPILGVVHGAQVMAAEPFHRVGSEDAESGRISLVARAAHAEIGDRIDQRLQTNFRPAPVARDQRHDRGEVGAGAVAMHAEPFRIGAEARGVGVHPVEPGHRILDRRRKAVLRPHPVVDRDDDRLRPAAQIARDQIVAVETADHMPAAVEIDDRRQGPGGVRPIDPHRDRARRAGDRAVLDARGRQRLGLARGGHDLHLPARRVGRHRLDRLQVEPRHRLQHFLDLRVQVRHRLPPARNRAKLGCRSLPSTSPSW